MNVIEFTNVEKTYRIIKKEQGIKGALKNLFKSEYTNKTALKDFSFEVCGGEFLGLIGPNGAGKTTIMKLLTGIIVPTKGKISVLGYEPKKLENAFKKEISLVMGQKSQLWWDLPAIDSFVLNKEIYEISDKEFREKIDLFSNTFGLKDLMNIPVRKLSLGERMKMELVSCLLHNPKLILLDEPTIGLDVIAQKAIHDFLKEINQKLKVTIILTSHYMEEIRELCDRVIIINEGEKVFDGIFDELITKYTELKKVDVLCGPKVDVNNINCKGFDYEIGENNHVFFWVEKEKVSKLLQDVFSQIDVIDITIEEEELASVIQKIYKETSKK